MGLTTITATKKPTLIKKLAFVSIKIATLKQNAQNVGRLPCLELQI